METLLIVVMLFIVLDIASFRWVFDSTEKIDSPEWSDERPGRLISLVLTATTVKENRCSRDD